MGCSGDGGKQYQVFDDLCPIVRLTCKLSNHERVRQNGGATQQFREPGLALAEVLDPNGGIDQHHPY